MSTTAVDIELQEQLAAFGSRFKDAYRRAGLSKRAVASAIPLDRSAIGRIERGKRGPHFETLLRMARAAKTTPRALLEGGPEGRVGGRGGKPQQSVEEAARRFGENLKRVRGEPVQTQEDLAFDAKVDRSSLSGYETGRVAPSVPTIIKLAKTLGVTPGTLLEGVGLANGAGGH